MDDYFCWYQPVLVCSVIFLLGSDYMTISLIIFSEARQHKHRALSRVVSAARGSYETEGLGTFFLVFLNRRQPVSHTPLQVPLFFLLS